MSTLPNPDTMSAEERAAEVTTILAACLLRISTAHQEKPEQKACDSEVRLGFLPDQRVHTTPSQHKDLS